MDSKKKALFLSILVILIGIVAGVGITYAYWASKLVLNNDNVVSSGCLQMEFKDLSNPISENRVGPGSYGGNRSYTFTITNTCTTAINYQVNLETLEGTTMNLSKIDLYYSGSNAHEYTINNEQDLNDFFDNIFEYEKDSIIDSDTFENQIYLSDLEEVTPTLSNAIKAGLINKYVIKPNETHIYEIQANVDWNISKGEEEEKTWYSKVTVNSIPTKDIKVTLDYNDNNKENEYIYLSSVDTYGTLPIPTKEGYIFAGWYLADDDTKYVTSTTNLYKDYDHKLIAKYLNTIGTSTLKENAFYDYETQISNDYCWGSTSVNCRDKLEEYSVKEIKPYYGSPTQEFLENTMLISESGTPTYMWVDNHILYYWSLADTIYMQKDRINGMLGEAGSIYHDIENLDLSRINTSQMTDMSLMFFGLYNIKELDLTNFDTSNVTDMSAMFSWMGSIETLDLSNFDTSNVINMSSMFSTCYSLKEINLSSFNTSNVTNMSSMFDSTGLIELDLTSFDFTNVEYMNSLFERAYNLEKVIFSENNNISNDKGMFCDGRTWDIEIINYTPTEAAHDC